MGNVIFDKSRELVTYCVYACYCSVYNATVQLTRYE